jgi:methionine sulfoxide reductase heme-binding subunit
MLARKLGGRWQPFAVAAALSLFAIGFALATGIDANQQARFTARYTARASFLAFLIVYLASPLWKLWPGELTRSLARRRRQWGLAFALAHFIHLGALLWFVLRFGPAPALMTILGGGLGYVLLLAMTVTSNNASQRRLGRNWKRLHLAGLHWLWFIFAFSYLGRISAPETRPQGLIFFPIALAALGVRLAARYKRRSAHPPSVAT